MKRHNARTLRKQQSRGAAEQGRKKRPRSAPARSRRTPQPAAGRLAQVERGHASSSTTPRPAVSSESAQAPSTEWWSTLRSYWRAARPAQRKRAREGLAAAFRAEPRQGLTMICCSLNSLSLDIVATFEVLCDLAGIQPRRLLSALATALEEFDEFEEATT